MKKLTYLILLVLVLVLFSVLVGSLTTFDTSIVADISISFWDNSTFALAYRNSTGNLYFSTYNIMGTRLSNPIVISNTLALDYNLNILALSNNVLATTYVNTTNNENSLRFYNSSGSILSTVNLGVNSISQGGTRMDLARLNSTVVILIYIDTNSPKPVWYSVYDMYGNELVNNKTLFTFASDYEPYFGIDNFNMTTIVVGFGNPSTNTTGFLVLDKDSGSIVTSINWTVKLNTPTTPIMDTDVCALDSTNFAMAWQSNVSTGSGRGVLTQTFRYDGTALGPPTKITDYLLLTSPQDVEIECFNSTQYFVGFRTRRSPGGGTNFTIHNSTGALLSSETVDSTIPETGAERIMSMSSNGQKMVMAYRVSTTSSKFEIFNSDGTVWTNTPPTTPVGITLNTTIIYVGQSIKANTSGSTDVDGDTISYYYQFYDYTDSTIRQDYSTTQTYTFQIIDAHGNIGIKAKSYDGFDYSTNYVEQNITTSNSIPAIGNPSLNNTSPTMVDTLNCNNGSFTDADGDTVQSYNWLWYKNNLTTGIITQTFKINGNATRFDNISCQERTYEGYNYSNYANSTPIQILNYVPTIQTGNSFINNSIGHKFNVSAVVYDADDNDTANTNISVSSGTCNYVSNSSTTNTFTSYWNCTGAAGASASVQIGFKDLVGGNVKTSATSNTYPNNLPTFTQSAPNISIRHDQNITVQLNATDLDSDTIIWGINTSMIAINQSGYISDNPLQAEIGNYSIQVNITDSLSTVENMIFTYEIINSAPTIASASITPDPATGTNDLTCNNGSTSDYESDTLTLYYTWFKGGVLQSPTTQVLGYGNLTTNDNWYCKINVSDGLFYSGAATSQTVIIGASTVSPSLNYTNATTATTNLASTSTNPTNNNLWVNLSITFYDYNTNDKWIAYFCRTNVFGSNCTGGEFCRTSNSTLYPTINCRYNLTAETTQVINYYVYVVDNTSLSQGSGSGKAGTFTINYPPPTPDLYAPGSVSPSNATWINKNYAILNPSSTDPDSDTVTYYIYTNTSLLVSFVNSTVSTYNFTGLNETTYYWQAKANDSHGYESSLSEVYQFYVDYTVPTIENMSLSASPYYTDTSVMVYADCGDSNSGINTSTARYNITDILSLTTLESMGYTSGNRFADVYVPLGVAGNYQFHYFTCSDLAGNLASQATSLNFTTSIRPVSGGGGSSVIQILATTPPNISNQKFCGDGICNCYTKENDTNYCESPGTCLGDCKVGFDNLLTCLWTDPSTCLYSESWFVNILIFVVIGGLVVISVLENQKVKKQRKNKREV